MNKILSFFNSIWNTNFYSTHPSKQSLLEHIDRYERKINQLLDGNAKWCTDNLNSIAQQFTEKLDRIEINYNEKLELIKNGYEIQIKYLTNSISTSVKIQMRRDQFSYQESIELLKKDFSNKLGLIKSSHTVNNGTFASYPIKSETIRLNYSNPNFSSDRIKVDLSRKLAQYVIDNNLIDGNYDVKNNQVTFSFNLNQIEI